MLFISSDNKSFICTDVNGSPCFMRGDHLKEAKRLGLELDKMDNMTFAYIYTGKGISISNFLGRELLDKTETNT